MTGNLTVLLARPEGENEALARELSLAGFEPLVYPLLNLAAIETTPALKQQAMNLDQVDLLVFVSKNAVRYGMPLLDRYWPQWPAGLEWYAVGTGTATALLPYGVSARYPENAGSEGLLELLPADLEEKQVMIVRGIGGRELLADTCRSRGASVSYLEAYRREMTDGSGLPPLADGSVVVLTSGEILQHFVKVTTTAPGSLTVVVPSARIAEAARTSGFGRVENAGGASDQALYDAVLRTR